MQTATRTTRRTVWFVSALVIGVTVVVGSWLSTAGGVNLWDPLGITTSNHEMRERVVAPANRAPGQQYNRPTDRLPGFANRQAATAVETVHRPTDSRSGQ